MLKKIAVGQLTVGMHLQELCGSWIQHPFWRSKFVITDQKDIRLIAESGITEVIIDTDKGGDVAVVQPAAQSEPVVGDEPAKIA